MERRRQGAAARGFVFQQVNDAESTVAVEFTPTIPHCSMATLIGLSIKVKLIRSLPERFKVSSKITLESRRDGWCSKATKLEYEATGTFCSALWGRETLQAKEGTKVADWCRAAVLYW